MNCISSIQNILNYQNIQYELFKNPTQIQTNISTTTRIATSTNANVIYLWNSSGGNAYVSVNAGANFTIMNVGGNSVLWLVCDSSGQYACVLVSSKQFWYSSNYGSTWAISTLTNFGSSGTISIAPVSCLTSSLSFGNIISLGGSGNVFLMSATNGSSFTSYNGSGNLPNNATVFFRTTFDASQMYYIVSSSLRTIFKVVGFISSTSASSFYVAGSNIVKIDFNKNQSSPSYFFITATNNVYLSVNGGSSFTNLTSVVPFSSYSTFKGCAVSYSGKYIAICPSGSVLIYSTDFGTTWKTKTIAGSLFDCEFVQSVEFEQILIISTVANGTYGWGVV